MRKNCFTENLGATVYENLDQYPPPPHPPTASFIPSLFNKSFISSSQWVPEHPCGTQMFFEHTIFWTLACG